MLLPSESLPPIKPTWYWQENAHKIKKVLDILFPEECHKTEICLKGLFFLMQKILNNHAKKLITIYTVFYISCKWRSNGVK